MLLTQEVASPEERLHLWLTFRNSIKRLDRDTQLEKVAEFFSRTPISSRTMDFYTPSEWMTPWEILHDGRYCESAISLLIYYTLKLIGMDKVELWLVDDQYDRLLLPIIDNQYILNYELGKISKLHSQIKIVDKYTQEQIPEIA